MKYLLGIDVGAHGAIAVLDMHLDLVDVIDMPTMAVARGKRKTQLIDGATLSACLAPYKGAETLAAIEYEGSRPGNSASSMFAFGSADGVVRGVLACLGIRLRQITPAQWKKAMGLPSGADKDLSRGAAAMHYPSKSHLFERKKDDGRAEGVLIALAVAREIPALVLDLGAVPPGVIARHLKTVELPVPAVCPPDLVEQARS